MGRSNRREGDLPWFPLNVRDWLSSANVRALTAADRAHYMDLLAHTWEQAATHGVCSLPADDGFLGRLLGLSPEEWGATRKALVDGPGAVMRVEGGRLVNGRLQREWEEANRVSQARSKVATEAAAARAAAKEAAEKPPEGPGDGSAIAEQLPGTSAANGHTQTIDMDNDIDTGDADAIASDSNRPGERAAPSLQPISPHLLPRAIASLWNERCGAVLPKASAMTGQREKHVRARLGAVRGRDADWWTRYFDRIAASAFCRGSNARSWRATFDWAVRSEDVVAKVLEGTYDDRAPAPAVQRSRYETASERSVREFNERMDRAAREG